MESTLRRNLKSGKVSFTTDKQENKQVDTAELERVYGNLTINDNQNNGNDTDKIVKLLEGQNAELKEQIAELIHILKNEQEKTKLLMLTTTPVQKKPLLKRIFRFT